MRDTAICEPVRTPVGRFGGSSVRWQRKSLAQSWCERYWTGQACPLIASMM